jgi:hypothetical protein
MNPGPSKSFRRKGDDVLTVLGIILVALGAILFSIWVAVDEVVQGVLIGLGILFFFALVVLGG